MTNVRVNISIDTLIAWSCLVAGVALLFLTAMGLVRMRDGFGGAGLAVMGAMVYFSGRLERMDARERAAFDMGRESAGEGVRKLR